MTNANHPKNQKQKAAQESSPDHQKACHQMHCPIHKTGNYATNHNPKPWVVVENAGQDDEEIRGDFATFEQANRAVENWYYPDELENLGVQIMRRREDGVLTTEY